MFVAIIKLGGSIFRTSFGPLCDVALEEETVFLDSPYFVERMMKFKLSKTNGLYDLKIICFVLKFDGECINKTKCVSAVIDITLPC